MLMLDSTDKQQRNVKQQARVRAARQAIEQQMKSEGWQPKKLRGYSKRYRVVMKTGHSAVVAIKVQTLHHGWMGWAQKIHGWRTPLTDTDYILMATPYQGGLGVWMAPTSAVRDRLELVQQYYMERGRKKTAALWFNLFDLPNQSATQSNFAEGKPPMWVLPLDASDTTEADESQEAEGDVAAPTQTIATSGLSAFSNGQLIDELMRRGLKSFSFG